MNLYLGIDFGTSGARAIVINNEGMIQAQAQYSFSTNGTSLDNLAIWQKALFSLIEQVPQKVRQEISAIAIDGTSSTVLLCDPTGQAITDPILYNDARGIAVMEELNAIAPPHHTVLSATSSLAKLLWFLQNTNSPIDNSYFLHQADWLAFLLHRQLGISD